MKRVIVMRHAKSSWSSGVASDHQRPLNPRGQRDAPRIAQELARLGWAPDHVLCSDAARTHETWAYMADELPVATLDLRPELYHSSRHDLEPLLARLPDTVSTVLCLGHNPGWEHMVSVRSGQAIAMKTANAALFRIASDSWKSALQATWELDRILRPKGL